MISPSFRKSAFGYVTILRRKFRNAWRKIPLFGALAEVRLKDHTEALTEVGLTLILSTVPIWFGALIMLLAQRTNGTFVKLMISNMHSGEFCLYSTALLAPLYYFIFKNYPNRPHFPSGRLFMVIAALIILTSGGLFAVQRTNAGLSPHPNSELIFSLSWQVYAGAVIVV